MKKKIKKVAAAGLLGAVSLACGGASATPLDSPNPPSHTFSQQTMEGISEDVLSALYAFNTTGSRRNHETWSGDYFSDAPN